MDPIQPYAPACLRFSQLSIPRQALVRLCQNMNYGSIHDLAVNGAEPVFDPPPVVLIDVKLDSDEEPRPEVDLVDFELCHEMRGLVRHLELLTTGTIDQIVVRGGIARRIVLRGTLTASRLRQTRPCSPTSQQRPGSQTNGGVDHER